MKNFDKIKTGVNYLIFKTGDEDTNKLLNKLSEMTGMSTEFIQSNLPDNKEEGLTVITLFFKPYSNNTKYDNLINAFNITMKQEEAMLNYLENGSFINYVKLY